MSRAKDRLRAKLGHIYRSGKLWDTNMWLGRHKQAKVNAVEEIVSKPITKRRAK